MRKSIVWVLVAVAATAVAVPATAEAVTQNVVYLQGKGWKKWDAELAQKSGWVDRNVDYDGSASIGNSTEHTKVKNAIVTYCRNENPSSPVQRCVLVCYSAGCLRTLKAYKELKDADPKNVNGVLHIYASASAAGGTRMAQEATSGSLKSLAKLAGMSDPVDKDLVPVVARGSGTGQLGYVQNALSVPMYHHAGYNDACKKVAFFKFCGNKYAKVDSADIADGAVNLASAAGYAHSGTTYNFSEDQGCGDSGRTRYSWREWDSWNETCQGNARDHFGMPGKTVKIFASSAVDNRLVWGDNVTGLSDCTGSSCDQALTAVCSTTGNTSFARTPGTCSELVTGINTDTTSSSASGNTSAINSCQGRCGQEPAGWSCGCAAGSVTKCSNYAAANCANFNAR